MFFLYPFPLRPSPTWEKIANYIVEANRKPKITWESPVSDGWFRRFGWLQTYGNRSNVFGTRLVRVYLIRIRKVGKSSGSKGIIF